ncbi:hypothetical protein [uncultured Shewanella sp.]|uniref:hypothetical protein n=1 Tax=uncultured Shewanella sp. TaxID=173975 RepID=UPI002610D2C5|nr:hypothetical protein [uncultured Shewanella sp.]
MSCIFNHSCIQASGALKQNCSLDRESNAGKACLYHFCVSHIRDRKGSLCGVEIKSIWLEEQLEYRPLPHYYLTHIHELESMLRSLSVRLDQDSNIKQQNGQIFLAIERIYLLDSAVIKALISLAAVLRRLEMKLVIILNNGCKDFSLYTPQVKYLLNDAGIKFCLVCRFDENLQTLYPFDYLMFDSQDLKKALNSQKDNEIVDSLFTMRERGFSLILSGISADECNTTWLTLPFSSFQSVKA